jgi:hypothetical protein
LLAYNRYSGIINKCKSLLNPLLDPETSSGQAGGIKCKRRDAELILKQVQDMVQDRLK